MELSGAGKILRVRKNYPNLGVYMKKINIIGICAILLIITITVTTILTVIIITNKPKTIKLLNLKLN